MDGGELENIYSDGTLTILNGINRPMFSVKFKDMFPYSLSDIQFDACCNRCEVLDAKRSPSSILCII